MQPDPLIAVITGAGSGIGRGLAREAVVAGYHVVLTGRRASALEETRALLPLGARVTCIPADLTVAGDRARLLEGVKAQFSKVQLLINNAGIVAVGPLGEMDDALIERMVATNLVAPMALTRDFLGLLKAAGGARIINVGSMFGDIGFPLFPVYSATKFGLRGFSDAMRRELSDAGIGLTYAAPRATRTDASSAYDHLRGVFGMRVDDTERVARDIFAAAQRGRRSVYPLGPERLFTLIQRILPRLIDNTLIRQLRSVTPPQCQIEKP